MATFSNIFDIGLFYLNAGNFRPSKNPNVYIIPTFWLIVAPVNWLMRPINPISFTFLAADTFILYHILADEAFQV